MLAALCPLGEGWDIYKKKNKHDSFQALSLRRNALQTVESVSAALTVPTEIGSAEILRGWYRILASLVSQGFLQYFWVRCVLKVPLRDN